MNTNLKLLKPAKLRPFRASEPSRNQDCQDTNDPDFPTLTEKSQELVYIFSDKIFDDL